MPCGSRAAWRQAAKYISCEKHGAFPAPCLTGEPGGSALRGKDKRPAMEACGAAPLTRTSTAQGSLEPPAQRRPRAAAPRGSAPLTRGLNALPGQGTRGRARRRLLQPHSQEPESWVLPAPSKEHPAANSGRFQPGYGSSPSSGGCARVKSPRTPLTSSPSSFTLPACLSNCELVQKSFDAAVAPQSVTLIMKLSSRRLGQVHRAFLYKAYRGSPPSLKTLSSFLLFFFPLK